MFEAGLFPRDIALAFILSGFAGMALARPWLGVLGLAVLSYLHPQGYASGFMKTFPVYATLFFITLAGAGLALARRRLDPLPPRWLLGDWRVYALAGLWLWFALTSYFALAPWEAWAKFYQVARILPPLALTLLLVDDRRKWHALIVVVALSIMLVAFKGGYWAVMSGFQDRVYGPPGSQYGDNNEFAVAVCMAIPLLSVVLRETRDSLARGFLLLGIALCYGAVISSWSRGGMLALAAVTLVLVLQSRRKWTLIPALLLLGAALFVQLPETWFGRMQTVQTTAGIAADASAQNRLAVWQIGFDLALKRPLTGGGFNAWPALTLGQGDIDWHSIYVKLLAEHGFVGLAWWLALMLGNLLHLARAAWRPAPGYPAWATHNAAMLLAASLAYLIGGATLGISYWELPYFLVVMAILLGLLARKGEATVGNSYTARGGRLENYPST